MKKALLYMAYTVAYGFWWFVSLLPFSVLYALSDVLYLLMSRVIRYRHRVIWHNLTTSFPEKTEAELREIERKFYHWFCDYIVETVKLMTISKQQIMKRMTFTGTEKIEQLLAEGRSIGVYLGHLGNWEWITSLPYWLTNGFAANSITPWKTNISTAFSNTSASDKGLIAFPCRSRYAKSLRLERPESPSSWVISQTKRPFGGTFIIGWSSCITTHLCSQEQSVSSDIRIKCLFTAT